MERKNLASGRLPWGVLSAGEQRFPPYEGGKVTACGRHTGMGAGDTQGARMYSTGPFLWAHSSPVALCADVASGTRQRNQTVCSRSHL